MEDIIELYLFKYKICPLLSLGSLKIIYTNAVAQHSKGRIEPVLPTIKLLGQEIPAEDFIQFIAYKKNIHSSEAEQLLIQYCSRLQNMDAFGETKLPHAGKFYVDAEGNLVFKAIEIPKAFLPVLSVERVIHPATAHAMVVGDKETTTTEMAAYYSDIDSKSTEKWWIGAALLAVVAAGLLVFHIKEQGNVLTTGNKQPIEILPVFKTYAIAE